MILRALAALTLAVLPLLAQTSVAHSTPITSITHLNSFRDTRSANAVGIGIGDFNQFGADIVPRPGTTITGVQGITVGPNVCTGLAVNTNFCATATPFSTSRLGAWALTFQNGSDTAPATTPTLAGMPTEQVPFPTSVRISNSGTTPTLSWTVPGGFTPDAVRVQVFDKQVTLPNGAKDVIFTTALQPSQTSFQIPANNPQNPQQPLLKPDGQYVLNVQLIETREHAPLVGNFNDNVFRRSSSFFEFSPVTGPQPAAFLPTRGPGVNAPYQFQVDDVVAGETIFIDPFVAVGYKYVTGPGDPNFASVMLPAVGDDVFDLSYLVGQTIVLEQVLANQQFFFPSGGVSAFDVTGIETSAMLDPDNVTAFVTGLTFAASGNFTGTMTPIVTEVPDLAPVPEPATILLLGSAFAGVGVARWRQRRWKVS